MALSRSLRNGILLVAVLLLLGPGLARRLFPSKLVGHKAPDFALPVVYNGEAGSRMRLSDLTGRTVLLDFWATWCGPCQMEAPVLARVARRHQDEVVVVGVNTSDEPGLAEAFAKKLQLGYPIVYDDGNHVAEAYNVENLPTLVVVDPRGQISTVRTGVEGDREIDDLLARAK